MPTDFHKWRISDQQSTLSRNSLPSVGLPPVVQWFPRDYSVKKNDAVGGIHRDGFLTYEVLWTRMDTGQLSALMRYFNLTVGSDLYFTGYWYDTVNPVVRFVDLRGKPDLSDPTPNAPAFGYGVQVFSAITLKLNNVVLINDPATY